MHPFCCWNDELAGAAQLDIYLICFLPNSEPNNKEKNFCWCFTTTIKNRINQIIHLNLSLLYCKINRCFSLASY